MDILSSLSVYTLSIFNSRGYIYLNINDSMIEFRTILIDISGSDRSLKSLGTYHSKLCSCVIDFIRNKKLEYLCFIG